MKNIYEAERLYKKFTSFDPRYVDDIKIDFDEDDTFVQIAKAHSIVYKSDKWDGIMREYEHSFKKKPRLITNSQGNILILADGSFSITPRGILK